MFKKAVLVLLGAIFISPCIMAQQDKKDLLVILYPSTSTWIPGPTYHGVCWGKKVRGLGAFQCKGGDINPGPYATEVNIPGFDEENDLVVISYVKKDTKQECYTRYEKGHFVSFGCTGSSLAPNKISIKL